MQYNDRLRVVVDEIRKSLNQVFDDANITPAQIVYWVRITANDLLSKHIIKRSSGAFLNSFDNIPVLIASSSNSTNNDVIKSRKLFQLPKEIFDFDEDRGIEYISYVSDGGPLCPPRFTEVTFQRTTQKKSRWLGTSKYTIPSPENPYWYRTGHNIYLLGIEAIDVPFLEIGIYTPIDPLELIDLNYDQPFNFPSELMDTLKKRVLDLARYSYLFPKESRSNQGDDSPEQGPTVQKIASVNQPQQPTE